MRVFLLIILLSWPWELTWIPEILSVGIAVQIPGETPCRPEAIACYVAWEETMYISPHPTDWHKVGSLQSILFHELQHHLQYKSGIMWDRDEWDDFGDDVIGFYLDQAYNEHQQGTVSISIANDRRELHANLPLLLDGELPCDLEEWYPWFEFDGCERE